jgi:hypothetical protein
LKIWREKWHRYLFVTSEAENQSFFHWLKKMFFFLFFRKKNFSTPRRHGALDIASASGSEDPG